MKKIIASSTLLLIFLFASIIIFQISCKKDTSTQSPTSNCILTSSQIIGRFKITNILLNQRGVTTYPITSPDFKCDINSIYNFQNNNLVTYEGGSICSTVPAQGNYYFCSNGTLGLYNFFSGDDAEGLAIVTNNGFDFYCGGATFVFERQ